MGKYIFFMREPNIELQDLTFSGDLASIYSYYHTIMYWILWALWFVNVVNLYLQERRHTRNVTVRAFFSPRLESFSRSCVSTCTSKKKNEGRRRADLGKARKKFRPVVRDKWIFLLTFFHADVNQSKVEDSFQLTSDWIKSVRKNVNKSKAVSFFGSLL